MRKLVINPWAVLVCVILSMVVGAVWYGIFADQWMAAHELTMDYITENETSTPYIIATVGSIITCLCMAWVFTKIPVESAVSGLLVALFLGFGFNFVSTFTHNAFAFKSFDHTWIDGGESLVHFAVIGLILGGWRKYKER